MLDNRVEDIKVARKFVDKLKSMESCGQDRYPFWYLYEDEFASLNRIIDGFQDFIEGKRDESH